MYRSVKGNMSVWETCKNVPAARLQLIREKRERRERTNSIKRESLENLYFREFFRVKERKAQRERKYSEDEYRD